MPLPIILGGAAALAAVAGVGFTIDGGLKMVKSKDRLEEAKSRNWKNRTKMSKAKKGACLAMDLLGENEMKVLSGFQEFSDLFERIKNRPSFEDVDFGDVRIPTFRGEEIKQASVGASVLIAGLGGAALGTAGGFAASGATTAAVMAFGKASTGISIAALKGVAATNATLAALGGGSIASGGGGMVLGGQVLTATTFAVGILVGGIIFSYTGRNIAGKADEAWNLMLKNESKINEICDFLMDLKSISESYNHTLVRAYRIYKLQLEKMSCIIDSYNENVDWELFSEEERKIVENTILMVGILYHMCEVKFVNKKVDIDMNEINNQDIYNAKTNAENVISSLDL